jgi:hypothetical protein
MVRRLIPLFVAIVLALGLFFFYSFEDEIDVASRSLWANLFFLIPMIFWGGMLGLLWHLLSLNAVRRGQMSPKKVPIAESITEYGPSSLGFFWPLA